MVPALVKPRYSELVYRAFELWLHPWRSRRLRILPAANVPTDLPRDRPLVVVANHTSWWDGFLIRDLHRRLRPGAPMHYVMLERELRRHPFLGWIGGVPLEPTSISGVRGLIRDLQHKASQRPDCTIVYFPQGRIGPAWQRPLRFRRGVENVVRAIGSAYVLPFAIHIEPLNHVKPTVFMAAGPVIRSPERDVTAALLESAVTRLLDQVQLALAEHGEEAGAHMIATQEAAWTG